MTVFTWNHNSPNDFAGRICAQNNKRRTEEKVEINFTTFFGWNQTPKLLPFKLKEARLS